MQWHHMRLKEVSYVGDYRVHVRYNNALEADIDLSDLLDHPAYASLRDQRFFAQVSVDPECGVLIWPGDLDMSPESTFNRVMQQTKRNA
jgi:hypothetical protein